MRAKEANVPLDVIEDLLRIKNMQELSVSERNELLNFSHRGVQFADELGACGGIQSHNRND